MARTILLVDDRANVRTLLRDYFTKEGFRVVTADNGRNALSVARNEKPDLITLSLADAGELKLNRQQASPQLLLEETAAAFSHQAEQRNIALQVRSEPGLPDINVDRLRMAQVLSNLVSNAMRYTPDNGRIILSARRESDELTLVVEDNGKGIAPEVLPCIFERFYRGDPSREQDESESGLGLAIGKSLVEAHSGRIVATSAGIGHGSTFVITLPLSRPA